MGEPLVSICIPAYNSAEYISETIESVLKQTYQNIELIVVDDQSKDNTVEVVSAIAERDSRLKLYRNEQNLGMAGNWNHCMELCTGEYIKLMCADDLLHETLIAREVEIMEKYPEVSLVESDTLFINLDGKKGSMYTRYKSGVVDGKKAARACVFTMDVFGAPQANLMRREAYEKVGGFDEHFRYILDYDFFMTMALQCQIYTIREPLNFFRIRDDSNTGNVMTGNQGEAYVAEHRALMEKHAKELGLSPMQINLSVLVRRLRSFLGGIYVKIFS